MRMKWLNEPVTLPWMVPSPAEKNMRIGLTTLSRKKQIVTKTSTKGTLLNLGEKGPPGESMTPRNETPGKQTRKQKQRRWDTPGEKWRGWPRTENGGIPWSMAYAPSEQKGISNE